MLLRHAVCTSNEIFVPTAKPFELRSFNTVFICTASVRQTHISSSIILHGFFVCARAPYFVLSIHQFSVVFSMLVSLTCASVLLYHSFFVFCLYIKFCSIRVRDARQIVTVFINRHTISLRRNYKHKKVRKTNDVEHVLYAALWVLRTNHTNTFHFECIPNSIHINNMFPGALCETAERNMRKIFYKYILW